MLIPVGFSEIVAHSIYARIADERKEPLQAFEVSEHNDSYIVVSMTRFYLSVKEVYETIQAAARKLNHEGLIIAGSTAQVESPLEQSLKSAFPPEQIAKISNGESELFDKLNEQLGEEIPIEPETASEQGIRLPMYVKMRLGLLAKNTENKIRINYNKTNYQVTNDGFEEIGNATIGVLSDYPAGTQQSPFILNAHIKSSKYWKRKQITYGFLGFLMSYAIQAKTLQTIPEAQKYLMAEFCNNLINPTGEVAPQIMQGNSLDPSGYQLPPINEVERITNQPPNFNARNIPIIRPQQTPDSINTRGQANIKSERTNPPLDEQKGFD